MPKLITPDDLCKSGTEDGEQAALFCYARQPDQPAQNGPYAAQWSLLYAIPNGGKRSAATAARLKATGTKKGIPDVCLPVARGDSHALYIELKRRKTATQRAGTTQDDQNAVHDALRREGNCVFVCYGWREAMYVVTKYLEWAN